MHNTLPCLFLIRIPTIYLLYYKNINFIHILKRDRTGYSSQNVPKKSYTVILYRHRSKDEKYRDINFRSYRPPLHCTFKGFATKRQYPDLKVDIFFNYTKRPFYWLKRSRFCREPFFQQSFDHVSSNLKALETYASDM